MWKFGTVDTTSPEPELDLTWLHTIFGMGGRPKRSLMPTRRSDRWPRSTAQLRLSWSIQKKSRHISKIKIVDRTSLYGRYALYSEDDFAGYVNSSPYQGYN